MGTDPGHGGPPRGPTALPIDGTHAPLMSALHGAAFNPRGERGWTEEEFHALMSLEGVFGLICARPDPEGDLEAEGFILMRAVHGEGEVLTIATRPDRWRRGTGRFLMATALEVCADRATRTVFLEVAEDNTAALALYEGLGFHRVGRRPGYYRRGPQRVDALVLAWETESCSK